MENKRTQGESVSRVRRKKQHLRGGDSDSQTFGKESRFGGRGCLDLLCPARVGPAVGALRGRYRGSKHSLQSVKPGLEGGSGLEGCVTEGKSLHLFLVLRLPTEKWGAKDNSWIGP